jgi:hypothetical protein
VCPPGAKAGPTGRNSYAQAGAPRLSLAMATLQRLSGALCAPEARDSGGVQLAIPRLRKGSYFPSFLEPRRTAKKAPVAVVQEAYVHGISTRAVDDLVKALGAGGMSKRRIGIVHLLRRSLDFVSWKDRRAVAAALKDIYRAVWTPPRPRRPCRRSRPGHGARNMQPSAKAGAAPGAR